MSACEPSVDCPLCLHSEFLEICKIIVRSETNSVDSTHKVLRNGRRWTDAGYEDLKVKLEFVKTRGFRYYLHATRAALLRIFDEV